MKQTNTSEMSPLPTPTQMLLGTLSFGNALIKSPKTLIGMTREVVRTSLNKTSHTDLNQDQYPLLENGYTPKYIAVLVPGFQLDGTSLLGFKKTLNEKGIPAFFPGGLPSGMDAVLFRQHPDELVVKIVKYVREIQKSYPETEIILMGHSAGGTMALHAVDRLSEGEAGKVTPVTVAGVLDSVGSMAQAGHALYYRVPSQVFLGKEDSFIQTARDIQLKQRNGITVVDLNDGYLSPKIQSGTHYNEIYRNNVIISHQKSPGHYRQGVSEKFSRYVIEQVLEKLTQRERLLSTPR